MSYILLVVGFILLIKGADLFVDSSVAVARRFNISPIVIGMTIIAIGTSLPEITISVLASFKGNNGVAVGNILGSNILNFCIILGIVALIKNIPVSKNILKVDYLFLAVSEICLLVFGLIGRNINRLEGVVLLIIFISFILVQIKKSNDNTVSEVSTNEKEFKPVFIVLFLIIGCIAIKFGGDFVVDSATDIAKQFGLSDNLIGLTIVAFGTSLPELVTSIIAARKNQVSMAFGNVIGSNIANIALALSLTSIVSPISYIRENIIDTIVCVIVSIFVFLMSLTSNKIEKLEGVTLLGIYIVYFAYLFIR